MQAVVLVIHLIIALALIGTVLVQRSEGGGLGIGGGQGGMGSFASVRGTANFLTRLTGILAAAFMVTSLTLAIMASNSDSGRSILDVVEPALMQEPAPVPPEGVQDSSGAGEVAPTQPEAEPTVPVAQ